MKRWRRLLVLLLACVLVLPACSAGGQDPQPEPGVTTLIYAQLSENGIDREAIDEFNRSHKDIKIEVRNYADRSENGRSGVDLLIAEITAGQVPDIIELGADGQTSQLPYRRLAEKGYLENLWPYIENDPDLGREAVMEAPLKAAEISGGLYTVFSSVRLCTLAGAAPVVGDRTSWTVDDLREAFASMPEGSVILDNRLHVSTNGDWVRAPSMKAQMLSALMYTNADTLVDWETGRCSFDSLEFRSCLELAGSVPDEYEWSTGRTAITDSEYEEEYSAEIRRMMDGQVMLDGLGLLKIYNMLELNFYFGGQAAIVGYPVGDGSCGSYFAPTSIKLSMSSACQDKDAAWQYIRQLLLPKQVNGHTFSYPGIPVNQKVYAEERKASKKGPNEIYFPDEQLVIDIGRMSEDACQQFEVVFNNTTRCSLLLETDILAIIQENAGAYFAGDKTLDETVQLIQNRVQLYVNEMQ